MHRLLERLDNAAAQIVPLLYLLGLALGTASYFAGITLAGENAGLTVGATLAIAAGLHRLPTAAPLAGVLCPVRAAGGSCARARGGAPPGEDKRLDTCGAARRSAHITLSPSPLRPGDPSLASSLVGYRSPYGGLSSRCCSSPLASWRRSILTRRADPNRQRRYAPPHAQSHRPPVARPTR